MAYFDKFYTFWEPLRTLGYAVTINRCRSVFRVIMVVPKWKPTFCTWQHAVMGQDDFKSQILHNDSFQALCIGRPPSVANKKFDLVEWTCLEFKISLKYIVTVLHYCKKLKIRRQGKLKAPNNSLGMQDCSSIYIIYKIGETILILITFAPQVQHLERPQTRACLGQSRAHQYRIKARCQLHTDSKTLSPCKS